MGYAGGVVLVSFCYVVLCWLLQLVVLRVRSKDFKELEIVVLRHELAILQRLYVLFFIELSSRRVHLAGCTPNPSALWVIQCARQVTWTLVERSERFCFLRRDRDQKFTDGFDDVFRSDGMKSFARRFALRKPTGWPSGSCAPSARSVSTGCSF